MVLDLHEFSKRSSVVVRPMFSSAFSLFFASTLVQLLGNYLSPGFWILSNRGIGKVIFTVLALSCCSLPLATALPTTQQDKLWQTCVMFLCSTKWLPDFFLTFASACIAHALVLAGIVWGGYALYHPILTMLKPLHFLQISCGFIATFFLALTEEFIFRGIFYSYFAHYFRSFTACLVTSTIFMFAHNIIQPWVLVTHDKSLGFGLFLIGLLLNLLFMISGKLYIGMGMHAGLVFVKVVLRKIPCITFLSPHQLPWWLHQDLRQAPLVHLLLTVVISMLAYHWYRSTRDLPWHGKSNPVTLPPAHQ